VLVPSLGGVQWLVCEYRRGTGHVRFQLVRGHSDDAMNDVVDRLATEAARAQAGRSGSEPPTALGPADEPRASRRVHEGVPPAGGAELTTGWRLIVLGHRPPELGGYDPSNPVASAVRRRLVEVIAGLKFVHDDLLVVTGLALGAEQLGAEAAVEAGVPYAAVLAYPDFDAVWPAESRRRYAALRTGAAISVVLSAKKPPSKQAAGMALGARNDWLVATADGAIVVWDRRDANIDRYVRDLERRVPDDVLIVEP